MYRVMPPRNTRRGRQAAPLSAEASHSLPNESIREPPPLDRQEMNVPPTVPRAKRFEQLRKLRAVPFCGTLDPDEVESWLENTERVFNLMQCMPRRNSITLSSYYRATRIIGGKLCLNP